jgi:hypothetical protein
MLVGVLSARSASDDSPVHEPPATRDATFFFAAYAKKAYGQPMKSAKQIRPMSKESTTIIGLPLPQRRGGERELAPAPLK